MLFVYLFSDMPIEKCLVRSEGEVLVGARFFRAAPLLLSLTTAWKQKGAHANERGAAFARLRRGKAIAELFRGRTP